ncbi:esterase/lipase family protein [Nocardia suismassiliense]|uniref:esterase/lipase family protein n=1 Tax=Nocardia suismassiliense TaxID=2077092 RepID=UPI001F3D9AC7|nr:alpha/beta fold hydrolase [Nocardia suismassiliense]
MFSRTRWGRFGAWLGVAVLACGAASGGATASAEPVIHGGQFPVTFDLGTAIIPFFLPELVPPGANDPNCVLTPEHPRPVILINGTGVNQAANWRLGAPFLRNNGYCVFTFNYGNPKWISEIPVQAVTDIRASARELAAQVDKVRALTGADKVDLVGSSQGGGVLPNYYINIAGGDRYVDKLVGLAPSNHGTTANGQVFLRKSFPPLGGAVYSVLEALLPVLTQQMIGSDLIKQTFGQGDTRPGVTYTNLVSRYDEVVTPYTNQFLDGPNVSNIVLQDSCADDFSDHISINFNERAWRFVLNALDPEHATPVPCMPQGFLFPGIN